MAPIRFSYKPRDLPREFDSRAKWTYLNNHILDQGWCGASWAFSTASVASDRFLIDSKGREDVRGVAGIALATPFFTYMHSHLEVWTSAHLDFWPFGIRTSGLLIFRPTGPPDFWPSGFLVFVLLVFGLLVLDILTSDHL